MYACVRACVQHFFVLFWCVLIGFCFYRGFWEGWINLVGLVGSVGFGLRLPLRDPELMSFYRRRYISSTSRVLIGFRASDAFVWYLIEDGLVFVGFFFLGCVCCFLRKLDLELMSSMERWHMYFVCSNSLLVYWSDSGSLVLFRISEVFERMRGMLWLLGCDVCFFWMLDLELVSSTREQ